MWAKKGYTVERRSGRERARTYTRTQTILQREDNGDVAEAGWHEIRAHVLYDRVRGVNKGLIAVGAQRRKSLAKVSTM